MFCYNNQYFKPDKFRYLAQKLPKSELLGWQIFQKSISIRKARVVGRLFGRVAQQFDALFRLIDLCPSKTTLIIYTFS